MLKKPLVFALILGTSSPLFAASDSILGSWRTHAQKNGGTGIVSFYKCGSKYCGKLVRTQDAKGRNSSSHPYLGKVMVKNLVYKNGKYSKGKLIDVENKRTVNSSFVPSGNKMKVKGCLAGNVLCRNFTWTKVR